MARVSPAVCSVSLNPFANRHGPETSITYLSVEEKKRSMHRFLLSLLLLLCLAPLQVGCGGEEEPLHQEEDVDNQIDPETEAEDMRKLKQN